MYPKTYLTSASYLPNSFALHRTDEKKKRYIRAEYRARNETRTECRNGPTKFLGPKNHVVEIELPGSVLNNATAAVKEPLFVVRSRSLSLLEFRGYTQQQLVCTAVYRPSRFALFRTLLHGRIFLAVEPLVAAMSLCSVNRAREAKPGTVLSGVTFFTLFVVYINYTLSMLNLSIEVFGNFVFHSPKSWSERRSGSWNETQLVCCFSDSVKDVVDSRYFSHLCLHNLFMKI